MDLATSTQPVFVVVDNRGDQMAIEPEAIAIKGKPKPFRMSPEPFISNRAMSVGPASTISAGRSRGRPSARTDTFHRRWRLDKHGHVFLPRRRDMIVTSCHPHLPPYWLVIFDAQRNSHSLAAQWLGDWIIWPCRVPPIETAWSVRVRKVRHGLRWNFTCPLMVFDHPESCSSSAHPMQRVTQECTHVSHESPHFPALRKFR